MIIKAERVCREVPCSGFEIKKSTVLTNIAWVYLQNGWSNPNISGKKTNLMVISRILVK